MAISPYIVKAINSNLFTDTEPSYVCYSFNSQGCECAFQSDNINGQMTRYVQPVGCWDTHNLESADDNGSFARPSSVGRSDSTGRYHRRPSDGYYIRALANVAEKHRYGTVASLSGTFIAGRTILDALSFVDYEPCYGHAVEWPHANTWETQLRDSETTHLPKDGSSTISLKGSNYSRSKYDMPSYLVAHITQGGTIGSGNIKFILEERPTRAIATNTKAPTALTQWDISTVMGNTNQNQRSFLIHLLRVTENWLERSTGDINLPYPDGSQSGDMKLGDSRVVSSEPLVRWFHENRLRDSAVFPINKEYFGVVLDTKISIHSIKMGLFPLLFVDLRIQWPNAKHPRIAGVACSSGDTNNSIYILSESGELACYDFTVVKNGELMTKAPLSAALPDESRCSGLAMTPEGKLYALVGNFAEHPYQCSSEEPDIRVFEYSPATDSWDTGEPCTSQRGRVGAHSLRQIIALSDGKLVMAVEKVKQIPTRNDVFRAETGWTVDTKKQSWGGEGQSKTAVIRLGHNFSGNTKLPAFKITLKGTSIGNYTVNSAKIARVEKWKEGKWRGGDSVTPDAGIPFDEMKPITFGSGLASAPVGTEDVVSDLIELKLDTNTNDYYILLSVTGTEFGLPYTDTNSISSTRCAFIQTPIEEVTQTTTAMFGTTTRAHFVGRVFNDTSGVFYTNAGVPDSGGYGSNEWEWQLLMYDPLNKSWNVNAVDGFSAGKIKDDVWLTRHPYLNLMEVQPNTLLFHYNWHNTGLAIVDVSQPLHTINQASITPIGVGSPGSVFPEDVTAGPVSVIKNFLSPTDILVKDKRVLFARPTQLKVNHNARCEALVAPVGMKWTQGGKLQRFYSDPGDRNTGGVSFRKNQWIVGDTHTSYGLAGDDHYWATLPLHFNGQAMMFYVPHTYSNSYGSYYPLHASYACYAYLPTYYKWEASKGDWVLADSFEDAESSPRSVPAEPGERIQALWNLKVSFGPDEGTTFEKGEWHTINATYGFVKFIRKARYTMALFTGKTFNITEQRPLVNYKEISFRPYRCKSGGLSLTATGPEGITYDTAEGTAFFPRMTSGGKMNDTPIVVTYKAECSASKGAIIDGLEVGDAGKRWDSAPDWSSNVIHPMYKSNVLSFSDGTKQEASASGSAGGLDPWEAFAGRMGTTGDRWQSSGSETWLQIRLRGDIGRKVRSYMFVDALRTITSWKLKASMDGKVWSDLHSVTLPEPTQINNCFTIGDPGREYIYYRLEVLKSTGAVSVSDFYLFENPLKDTFDITDIWSRTGWPAQGHKFEADKGQGFFEVKPLWISSRGEFRSFDRMTDVKAFRVTIQRPCNDTENPSKAWVPNYIFLDYGVDTTHITRLGSNAAAVNTPERGTYDPECLGIAHDVATLWVDDTSPLAIGNPVNWDHSGSNGAVTGWFYPQPMGPRTYRTHPFFGFIIFGQPENSDGSYGGLIGSPSYVPVGDVLNINYCWGRRV